MSEEYDPCAPPEGPDVVIPFEEQWHDCPDYDPPPHDDGCTTTTTTECTSNSVDVCYDDVCQGVEDTHCVSESTSDCGFDHDYTGYDYQ